MDSNSLEVDKHRNSQENEPSVNHDLVLEHQMKVKG